MEVGRIGVLISHPEKVLLGVPKVLLIRAKLCITYEFILVLPTWLLKSIRLLIAVSRLLIDHQYELLC